MLRPAHRWAMGGVLLALVCWAFSSGLGTAADEEKKVGPDIRKLAALEAKGDKAAIHSQAKSIADAVELDDLMEGAFKPRKGKAGGLGVGTKPGAIQPDGIEKQIQAIARDGIQANVLSKEADALEQMAYDSAAVADVALLKPPKPEGKKTPALWKEYATNMRSASLDLAKAVKSKDADAVNAATKKLNVSCNKCHSVFRD